MAVTQIDGDATEQSEALSDSDGTNMAVVPSGEADLDTRQPALLDAASTVWQNPDLLLEGRVARSAVIGAALGIVLFVIVIGGLGLWVGLDAPAALGLGAFTAFWGGLGFGGMVGAVLAVNRSEANRG